MERLGKKRGISRWFQANKWLLLAFFIPMIVMAAAMAWGGIYPFGNKLFISFDALNQYYPFMSQLRGKLLSGQSLFYSWEVGLGTNFWALIAYYCASPLNLLTVLVPQRWLMMGYGLLVACKLGLAGLLCAVFLKKVFRRNDASLTLFGCMYALCGFAAGYYWNIMWLDTFALLPMVVLGTWELVKEGKFRLYVIALALSLWCNFLIGLYVCIFTFFTFFALCFCLKLTWRNTLRRLVRIALCTVLAVCMTAVLLLPAFLALMQTGRGAAQDPDFWKVNASFTEIFGNLGTAIMPTWKKGAPNVYTSLPAVLLAAVYFVSRKVGKRQKLCAGAVLLLLLLSFHWNGLELLWNLMRNTYMLPARFSFLFSFVLIVVAYQALPRLMEHGKKNGVVMTLTAVVLLGLIGLEHGMKIAAVNAAILAVYGVLYLLFAKKISLRKTAVVAAALVLMADLALPICYSVDGFGIKGYASFPKNRTELAELQNKMDGAEKGDFYRFEMLPSQLANDPANLDYRGMSAFVSTLDGDLIRHLYRSGMASSTRANRYFFPYLSSPLNHAMLGLRYVVSDKPEYVENDPYLRPFAHEGKVEAYHNSASLSLGFMTGNSMAEPVAQVPNPFLRQNSVFKAATGLQQELYTPLTIMDTAFENITATAHEAGVYTCELADTAVPGTMSYVYEMPRDGLLYGYVYCNMDVKEFTVNGRSFKPDMHPFIFLAGHFKQGEQVVVSWQQPKGVQTDNVMVFAAVLEEETFDEGLALLADEQMKVQHFDAASVTGTIEVKQAGYFYTSIPYDEGWTMYVDGEEREITPYQNAMIALENLQPGHHTVELRYVPAGFAAGAWISAAGLAVFLAVCLWSKKKK